MKLFLTKEKFKKNIFLEIINILLIFFKLIQFKFIFLSFIVNNFLYFFHKILFTHEICLVVPIYFFFHYCLQNAFEILKKQ